MRFGTWNVTSLFMTWAVILVPQELAKFRLVLLGEKGQQAVRLVGNGVSQIGEYMLYNGKVNNNHQQGTGFFAHKRIKSAVKKVQFISDRLSY